MSTIVYYNTTKFVSIVCDIENRSIKKIDVLGKQIIKKFDDDSRSSS